jgi:succinate-semialdehyde dehydrogenase / glutarate-semialdehyde dehydrogenase
VALFSTLTTPSLLQTQSLIGGQWTTGTQRFAVHDPATGNKLAEVADLGAAQTYEAITAAQNALPSWSSCMASERSKILMAWCDLVREHANDLAYILTAEQGKPLHEARNEVRYGASFLEWFSEEGKRIYGETLPALTPHKRYLVTKQAIGVCAAITPWNFPLAMVARKLAPALAAGCTVVLKPSELTPLSALALAHLAMQAELPSGVLNVITGQHAAPIGQALCASTVVRHLSFTGSTAVGRLLAAQCAPSVKKIALELGGNAPFIVFDDADLDSAVQGAIDSKFRNAGQTCVSTNRFYVQSGIYPAFTSRLAECVSKLQVGNGFDSATQIGPLITTQAVNKTEHHVQDALEKGAKVLTGGRKINDQFFEPTVLTDACANMLCAHEETFGPIAPVFKFDTEDQAIALANDTEFGLAAYFYSQNIGRVFRVAQALEAGMVGVNTGLISTAEMPFGGIKQSGLGREGSRHGIDEYVELKTVCLGGL